MATMAYTGRAGDRTAKPPRMVISTINGFRMTLYRSPRVTSHSGDGQNWTESERAGRQSILRRESEKVPEYSMSIILGHQDYYKDVSSDLQHFINLSRHHSPITFTYSRNESGLYYITDFSYTVELRSPYTNEPSRVNINLTLRKATKDSIKTGPIAKPAPKVAPKPTSAGRIYVVRRGDTLWDIAQKYYGNPYRWTQIADRNRITNPRLLQIGTRLVIP